MTREDSESVLLSQLNEALTLAELQPALETIATETDASAVGLVRFPRSFVGELGAALVRFWKTPLADDALYPWLRAQPASEPLLNPMGDKRMHAWQQSEAFRAFYEPRHMGALLVLRLNDLAFAERGMAAVVLAKKDRPFVAREQAWLLRVLPNLAAAHTRVARHESVVGHRTGLISLLEQRLGACAALATARGDLVWVSEAAKQSLGEQGEALLQERVIAGLGKMVQGADGPVEFVLRLPGQPSLFGIMSFVRESPETSVHYVAVELSGSGVETHADVYKLTKAEREVYDLLVQGAPYEEIAKQRFVAMETVRSHAKAVFKKLGVSTRMELMVARKASTKADPR